MKIIFQNECTGPTETVQLLWFCPDQFLNQARAWFLKNDPVRIVGMRVRVCVCVCVWRVLWAKNHLEKLIETKRIDSKIRSYCPINSKNRSNFPIDSKNRSNFPIDSKNRSNCPID